MNEYRPRIILGDTWIESEAMNTDYGQFRRKGLVFHRKLNGLVRVQCDTPDTFISIPAVTRDECGYIIQENNRFEFVPCKDMDKTPKQYVLDIKLKRRL